MRHSTKFSYLFFSLLLTLLATSGCLAQNKYGLKTTGMAEYKASLATSPEPDDSWP